MTRVMANLDSKTAKALKAKAKADNRSLSSYVSMLIKRDVDGVNRSSVASVNASAKA
jgi:hypothetical protein